MAASESTRTRLVRRRELAHGFDAPAQRRKTPRAWSIVAVAVALACAPRRAAGRECVFNDDCAEGLVCAGDFCRRPCTSDRDCSGGETCQNSGDRGILVCRLPSGPSRCRYASDCTAPMVCSPLGECTAECTADRDCTLRSPRTRCVTGACVDPSGLTDVTSPDAMSVPDGGGDA